MNDYNGFPVRHLSSKYLDLDCLATAGPRIVQLKFKGSPNLLAEVPDISVPTPYGDYAYLGGHRLWHSPEAMPRTYIPDNDGLTITELTNGLLLQGKTEIPTGIQKRIEVHLDPEYPRVDLKHTLVNNSLWDVVLSPWTITMLRLGGIAIFPTQATNDRDELLPNRHISLWPYSHIGEGYLLFIDQYIIYNAKIAKSPFKMGAFNVKGWIAYWLDGILFRKMFNVYPGCPHPDYDCNAEIYSDNHFIELESLGPLTKLSPGQSVDFVETWELYDTLEQEFLPENIATILQQIP